jgi:hypothetical protein
MERHKMQTTLVVILANENHYITRWLGRTPTQVEIAAALYGATTADLYGTTISYEAESAVLITGTEIKNFTGSHIRWCVKNLLDGKPNVNKGTIISSSSPDDSTNF